MTPASPSDVLKRAKEIILARQATTIPEAIYEVMRETTNRAESLFVEANGIKNILKWRVGPKGISELAEALDKAIALAEKEEEPPWTGLPSVDKVID